MNQALHKLALACVSLTGFAATSAFAANVFWGGSTDGNFNIGANWGTGNVPGAGDAAFIRDITNNPIYQNAQHRTFTRLNMGIDGTGGELWQLDINGGSINTTGGPNNIGQQGGALLI